MLMKTALRSAALLSMLLLLCSSTGAQTCTCNCVVCDVATSPCNCSTLPLTCAGNANYEIILELEENVTRVTSTFENAGHLQGINPAGGYLVPGSGMRFPDYWVTLNSGLFSGNPSGTHIAVGLTGQLQVWFDEPVAAAGFHYTSIGAVTLEALDSAGNVLASTTGPGNSPGGYYSQWDPLSVDAGHNAVAKLRISGPRLRMGFDDVFAERLTPEFQVVDLAVSPGVIPLSSSQLSMTILSSPSFDATIVDPLLVMVGDPGSDAAVSPMGATATDVNLDGYPDLEVQLCVQDMLGEGALDCYTIQLMLTGATQATVGPVGNAPPGLQTAGERIEANAQRLEAQGQNAAAAALRSVLGGMEGVQIHGVVNVTVDPGP